jgi:hypothetical protein
LKRSNTRRIARLGAFDKIKWRKKKFKFEIQTWPKSEEFIKFKDLIKSLITYLRT